MDERNFRLALEEQRRTLDVILHNGDMLDQKANFLLGGAGLALTLFVGLQATTSAASHTLWHWIFLLGATGAYAAMFIAILMGFWKGPSTAGVLAASGAVAAGTHLVFAGPWYIVAGGLAGALYAFVTWRAEEGR